MTYTLEGAAKAYEPKQKLQNITELQTFSKHDEITTEERKNSSNETYTVHILKKDGKEYRIPVSVIGQIKAILEQQPTVENFGVIKTGTTKDDTKYSVVVK